MAKKLTALILCLVMVFALTACGGAKKISGSGTEEDPWLCGATKNNDVRVYIDNKTLNINGDGKMMDFKKLTDRPWNDKIGDFECINVFDGLKYIGKNAFKGAGVNCDSFDMYLCEEVVAIGAGAFEGANFHGEFALPSALESIGSRAFADTDISTFYFYSVPKIAKDAFENVNAKAYVVNGSGWDESNELGYGGKLEYKLLYKFEYEEVYNSDEISGSGMMYVPEDETLEYNAADCATEGYGFILYDVLEGDLSIDDPINPLLSAKLTGNVKVAIVYAKIME